MSGLAEYCLLHGWTVSGSDVAKSYTTKKLSDLGASIRYGHCYENIQKDIDLVIYSAAISMENPERKATADLGIPSINRGDFLGQIMDLYHVPIAISGTHGKTTTTSMVAEILMEAGMNPTIAIGGVLPSIKSSIKVGGHDFFVAEACEFSNSYLAMNPKISIILNIDSDHLDFFKNMQGIHNSFRAFAEKLPKDGTLIVNRTIPQYEQLIAGLPCKIITFGDTPDCDYSFQNLTIDDKVRAHYTLRRKTGTMDTVDLGVVGEHNAYNSLAAIAAAEVAGADFASIYAALLRYSGTNRRFHFRGQIGGVDIYDDYAHHPTEMVAALSIAQKYKRRKLWVTYQPHTYSRTKLLMNELADALTLADEVILTDIMPARETDDLGVSSLDLQKLVLQKGTSCHLCPTFDEAEKFILENCINGDLLITMGCGDVVRIADSLVGE